MKENSIQDLLIDLKNMFSKKDLIEIEKCYFYALDIYKDKLRSNGKSYMSHTINVSKILATLNVDKTTIEASLLHETVKFDNVDFDNIGKKFNYDIVKLIKNLNIINQFHIDSNKENNYAYLRNILVGLSNDVRVIYIKLADRLDNMRGIWNLDKTSKMKASIQNINVLIPIAHRLGINSIKSELEDISLKYLKPNVYESISKKLESSKEDLTHTLNNMSDEIEELLKENEITYKIKARIKSIYSIYKKLEKGRSFSDIYDILALRIIVENESDCYKVLGLLHQKYRPIPKRFKDFIAVPKDNLYMSLHTSVFDNTGNVFEIQIRTFEMDEIDEHGTASHWSYKEKNALKIQDMMEQKLEMFRNIIDSNKENKSNKDFANAVSNDILSNSIYIFTPKGDIVELPENSTPLDFAFRIHTNIGTNAMKALVNEKKVSLISNLKDGDIVRIITSEKPLLKREYLKHVKTSQAKNKIKAYFNKQDRDKLINLGKYMLEKEIDKRNLDLQDTLNEYNIKKILKDLKASTLDDVYLSIGSLRFNASYIIELIDNDKHSLKDLLITKNR